MPKLVTRLLGALLAAALILAVPAPAIGAGGNGQLATSALSSIVTRGSCYQLRHDAAAAFNTMQLAHGRPLRTNGCASTYRRLGRPDDLHRGRYGTQWYFRAWWCARGRCANAAVPGTSNHGLGLALDLPPDTIAVIKRRGRTFGWCKCWSDAAHESWHFRWRAGVWRLRPDPGPDVRYPVLVEGSGGPGQAERVRNLQRALRRHGQVGLGRDGELGPATRKAVLRFQAAHKLPADGVVGRRTWLALRRAPIRPRPTAAAAPKPTPKPTGPVSGPDVSQWQPRIDWAKVRRAGHELAILKTSEGADWRDPTFSRERLNAVRKAGLVAGVYHFLRPRAGRSGKVEATFAVQVARAGGWGAGDLRLVADIESTTLSPSATCTYVLQFAARVKTLTRLAPIIYTYPGFAAAQLASCRSLRDRVLWIAHYGVTRPIIPQPWTRYALWQRSDRATIPGIPGPADLNTMPGGRAALERLRMPAKTG